MPDRYLREALLGSERWNSVSVDARDLYTRLLLLVDDYGVYDGRENIIAHKAYANRRDEPLSIAELQSAGLIVRFTNAGRVYLAITQWGESLRGRRKFPAPPINVDLPEVKYRGKYGAQMNWRNPQGSDQVSVLIDVNGRTVIPQPPEWRRTDTDWMPNGAVPYVPVQSRPAVTTSHGEPLRPAVASMTARQDGAPSVSLSLSLSSSSQSPSQSPSQTQSAPAPGASHGTPSLATTTTAPTSMIEYDGNGGWRGLGEAQRLRWQGMFADLSIPDQLERAAAWLQANTRERDAIAKTGEWEAFIVRWLLREGRGGRRAPAADH